MLSSASHFPSETILGIKFYSGSVDDAVGAALNGALVMAPSGPGLAVDLVSADSYRTALQNADINLTDSGCMLLLWRLRTLRTLPRISGLKYLQELLRTPELRDPQSILWVMPDAVERDRTLAFLKREGFSTTAEACYIAPHYAAQGSLQDLALNRQIVEQNPRVVVLCVGGGVQERLGLGLREAFGARCPGIVCTGAAIAFLSGGQAHIPDWADRMSLGWAFRIASAPNKFLPRYLRALYLFCILFRYGRKMPPLRGERQLAVPAA
ncbi:MAG: WecB/TagA/CpsF family glycosyltransferase [Verrucomicrobiota bacterium]